MIDLEITDGVAFITVNAPATRNALDEVAIRPTRAGAQLWSLRRRASQ
jgi:enoyl-CoA hydratase/carnithine racemase